MQVGVYQNAPVFGRTAQNLEQAIAALSEVCADLVVLPELFNTGYQFVSKKELQSLSETIPGGNTCRALSALCRSKCMHIVFGLAEKDGKRYYNSAVLMGPEGVVGVYRKAHLFFEEKKFFDPGDSGFQVFDMGKARIGMMICFDWLFPEAARVLALRGADIICHPANLVLPHCQRVMVTRSLENGVFSATANRIGTESRGGKARLTFSGQSQILDNKGKPLVVMGPDETGIVVVGVEVEKARDKQITLYNDRLADRRPDLYKDLCNGR